MARRRASRGVNTRPMRALVLDDVGAPAPPPSGETGTSVSIPGGLAGRERLQERRRRWEAERARFTRYRESGSVETTEPERASP